MGTYDREERVLISKLSVVFILDGQGYGKNFIFQDILLKNDSLYQNLPTHSSPLGTKPGLHWHLLPFLTLQMPLFATPYATHAASDEHFTVPENYFGF